MHLAAAFFLFSTLFFHAQNVIASEVIFAGDTTLAEHAEGRKKQVLSQRAIDRIDQADLFLWNLEFSGKSSFPKVKRFVFMTDPDNVVRMKTKKGVALLANNHSLDGGVEGLKDMAKGLSKHDMPYVGLRHYDPSQNFVKVKSGGRNWFLLNYTPMSRSGHPLYDTPSWDNILKTMKFLKKSRKENDIVIVAIHDGVEGTREISERQKIQAKRLADLGADIVSFTHSHTYIDPGMVDNTLVLWGGGNFVFGGNSGWRTKGDVRMMSVDPDTKEWKWIYGKTKDYLFDLK